MFALTRKQLRDPMLDLLYNLERRMGRVFEPFGDFAWRTGETTGAWEPAVDILEEPGAVRIVAEIPGVKPEDVKITVEGNMLTIQGTKTQTAEEKAEKIHRYERIFGAFTRTFTLPPSLDLEHIKATYGNGLLTLVLPKLEQAKARDIKVEVAPEP